MTPEPPIETPDTQNSREDTLESRNLTQIGEEFDALQALRGLAPGARITVHRQTPAFAKGFLDHLTVPQSGEIDIESEIKTSWGGGTYKLQPRQMAANGRMNFGRGCVILTIAGEPTLNGRRYVSGVLEEPGASVPAVQPYVLQNPPQNNRAGLEGQLLTMVQQTLARAGAPNGTGVDLAGLGTLITSMSGIMGGGNTPQGDAMGDMDRAFSLLTKMQKLSGMGSDSNQSSNDEDSADNFMSGGGWQQMLMMKMLGGSQPPQPPQYPPQYGQPPQQNWAGQQPTYPYNRTPMQPGLTNPPNWSAPPAGVPYSQPPHATPPPQAPARPPQAAPTPDPATMDGPHEAAAGGEEGPFTVANLQAELEDMSEQQRGEFMGELMQKLGIDEKLGGMFGSVVPAGAPNGAAQPAPPAAQPETFPGQPFDMSGAPFRKDD